MPVQKSQCIGTGTLLQWLVVGIAVVILVFGSVPVGHAQGANATIRGTVVDNSGALVPGANVVLTNEDKGVVVYRGTTTPAGIFVAPQVPTGSYSLEVEAPGMKKKTVQHIQATISQTLDLPIAMELGEVTDTVTVTSNGEQLQRSTSDISTLITPSEVQALPLANRDVVNLLALVPGVSYGGNGTALNSQAISFNGSRSLNTEMLLNGVSLVVPSTGYTSPLPPPDGITEMRVFTNNAPAEFGRTSGGVIGVNTRSGTNSFHGGVYSLVRNEALNANNYFSNLKNVSRSADRFFQFGGLLGGPVVIPHVWGKNRGTFFFVNYDRTIIKSPSVETDTVAPADWRTGDFSTAKIAIIDPTTNAPFLGNKIPDNRIDPAAKLIMARLPQSNFTGSIDTTNNRYTGNFVLRRTAQQDNTRAIGRLDQQFSPNDRLYVSIYRTDYNQPLLPTYGDPALSTGYDCNCIRSWTDSVGYTHTFSPTLVMDLNYGFFRNGAYRKPLGLGTNASSLFNITSLPMDQLPAIAISGSYTGIGSTTNTNQLNVTNTFVPFGSITKTWKAHTFKFGASYRWNQFNSFNPATYVNGNMNFTGEITNPTAAASNPANALADFLLGKVKTASYELPQPENGRRNANLGIYGQDDWRILPNLTLNLGVRYEYESPQVITGNQYSRIDQNTGQLLIAGKNASRSLNITTPKLDFSPRVGLSWSVFPKTVFRAAFGTFYGNVLSELGGQIAYPGYDVTQSFNDLGTRVAQPFSLSDGIPLTGVRDLEHPENVLIGRSPSNPLTLSGVQYGQLSPLQLIQQWNAGIQQQMPLNLIFELNYVGSHAVHLPMNLPFNLVPISQWDAVALAGTTTAQQLAKPYQNLGTFTAVMDVGTASYNALQASLRRQFSTRLSFDMNYTWSKNLDSDSSVFGNGVPTQTSAHPQYLGDPTLRKMDYAPSSFDNRNVFNLALQFTTPGPIWLHNIKISPVLIARSGQPINITQNNLIPNVSQQRPNGDVSGLRLANSFITGGALQYLVPASDAKFPLSPSGPLFTGSGSSKREVLLAGLGNVPRNAIYGPGELNVNLSLSRAFTLHERFKLELRADSFNVLNHTNLANPNVSLTATTNAGVPIFNSAGFGQITAANPARTMQLVGRISF